VETIKLSEQDIINAVCLYIAEKRQISPHLVSAELLWDEDYGFSAEVYEGERKQILIEANILEAMRFYLYNHLHKHAYPDRLELELRDEEGIYAYALYNR
jgi:hypothetical protein